MTLESTAVSESEFIDAEAMYADVEKSCRIHLSEERRRELSRLISRHVHLFRMSSGAPSPSVTTKSLWHLEHLFAGAVEDLTDLTANIDGNPEAPQMKGLKQMFEQRGQPLEEVLRSVKRKQSLVDLVTRSFSEEFVRSGAPINRMKRNAILTYADFFESAGGKT
jgi:hypothetical protein